MNKPVFAYLSFWRRNEPISLIMEYNLIETTFSSDNSEPFQSNGVMQNWDKLIAEPPNLIFNRIVHRSIAID